MPGTAAHEKRTAKARPSGARLTFYYSGTAWPSRVVPSGYVGGVDWDSQGYTGVTGPSGALDGDRWIQETA